jgi:hypothetical protein
MRRKGRSVIESFSFIIGLGLGVLMGVGMTAFFLAWYLRS